MNRGDVGLVLGLAGFLLGGGAIFVASSHDRRVSALEELEANENNEMFATLGSKVKALEDSGRELERRLNGLDVDPRPLSERISKLEDRVLQVEGHVNPAKGGEMIAPREPPK